MLKGLQIYMFADRLKEALNNKNMKQIDLVRCAQEKGVKLGKSHVSQYLSGKTIPRAEILHFIGEKMYEQWEKEQKERKKRQLMLNQRKR